MINHLLKEIDSGVFVIPQEIVAIEDHSYWTGLSPSGNDGVQHFGSVVVLKNGRKIYIKELSAKEVLEKLK